MASCSNKGQAGMVRRLILPPSAIFSSPQVTLVSQRMVLHPPGNAKHGSSQPWAGLSPLDQGGNTTAPKKPELVRRCPAGTTPGKPGTCSP